MISPFKPPIAVHFIWHPSDNEAVEPIIDAASKYLSRDINRPFSRNLNIPIFFYSSSSPNVVPNDYDNIVLVKSIVLKPEYRGQGLGGILALAIAERFGERDIVALKPWPMNPDGPENPAGVWDLPRLTKTQQKTIARKLRKSYQNAGFKPLFKGSSHLFLTHFRHPTVTELIDSGNGEDRTTG